MRLRAGSFMRLAVPVIEDRAWAAESGVVALPESGILRRLPRAVTGTISAEALPVAVATGPTEHPAPPDEVENAADNQQSPGETLRNASACQKASSPYLSHIETAKWQPPIAKLTFAIPLLLSVPLAAPYRHLPSTVRPEYGDAVKPARKCEGGLEGESPAAQGATAACAATGGAGRCAPSGGGVRCADSGGEEAPDKTRSPSVFFPLRPKATPPEAVQPPPPTKGT